MVLSLVALGEQEKLIALINDNTTSTAKDSFLNFVDEFLSVDWANVDLNDIILSRCEFIFKVLNAMPSQKVRLRKTRSAANKIKKELA